ncbi:MAG: phosphoribosylformylglycinamidine synthase subunit PurS [Candidatus Omnitrophica bacterium]|jgi:phosphoribosylformylglycinamidine synthase|nr:phosphoribosylformylglycinamidine synthase subunit PurS [Candidatus Omnitrophota bacterium]
MVKVRIYVTLKKQITDPQGVAIQHVLESLHFKGVKKVMTGKIITLELDVKDKTRAKEISDKMCRKILANSVTEDYKFEIEVKKERSK